MPLTHVEHVIFPSCLPNNVVTHPGAVSGPRGYRRPALCIFYFPLSDDGRDMCTEVL